MIAHLAGAVTLPREHVVELHADLRELTPTVLAGESLLQIVQELLELLVACSVVGLVIECTVVLA